VVVSGSREGIPEVVDNNVASTVGNSVDSIDGFPESISDSEAVGISDSIDGDVVSN
jgi:hypothetical protein